MRKTERVDFSLGEVWVTPPTPTSVHLSASCKSLLVSTRKAASVCSSVSPSLKRNPLKVLEPLRTNETGSLTAKVSAVPSTRGTVPIRATENPPSASDPVIIDG
jgi:hypothetical protein